MKPLFAALVILMVAVLTARPASAGEPTVSPMEPLGSPTPTSSATLSPTPEPIPPTPGPATPTPALPEEGGPPGGVIGGTLTAENVNTGEREPTGGTVTVEAIDGSIERQVLEPQGGRFEARGLPDGTYRVRWDPPVPEDLAVEIVPPMQDVELSPIQTVRASVHIVEIRNANRVLDLEFLVRFRPIPSAPQGGNGVQLPNTGSDGGASPGVSLAISLAGIAALMLVGAMLSRRRSA